MPFPAKTDTREIAVGPAEVVPITSGERLLPPATENSALEQYGEKAGRVLGEVAYSLGCAYEDIQTRLTDLYDSISSRSRRISINTRYRAHTLRQERPFQLLSIIAATAFGAGVAVRMWRSHS